MPSARVQLAVEPSALRAPPFVMTIDLRLTAAFTMPKYGVVSKVSVLPGPMTEAEFRTYAVWLPRTSKRFVPPIVASSSSTMSLKA